MDIRKEIKKILSGFVLNENEYIVYHGTNDKFDDFDANKTVDGTFWFTDSKKSIIDGTTGGVGNKIIMKRNITLNNPAGWDEYEKYSLGELINMGYDGVILPDDGVTDYIVFDSKSIRENEYKKQKDPAQLSLFEYLESFYVLNEDDSPSPTFEWDIAKEKIDDSKKNIKTPAQAQKYLDWFIEKVGKMPKSIKKKLIKYVAISLFGILGFNSIVDSIPNDMPEVKREVANTLAATNMPSVDTVMAKPKAEKEVVVKKFAPRKSSSSLSDFLKHEEGSIKQKGEPVLRAYDIGDGMVTIGWGHAEDEKSTKLRVGDEITREKAEELLASDIKYAEDALNRILNDWESKGIEMDIDQSMYDAMVSMIFNMGIGNFRNSDFIQMVKRGDYESASDEILDTNVTYPGHIPRRQKEKEMFDSEYETPINEIREMVRGILLNLPNRFD